MRSGFTNPIEGWRTGRSVGGPQGPLPGRESAARRAGLKGGPKFPPGSGCEEYPVRFGRTARYDQNTAVERRLASGPIARAAGSPSHGEHVSVRHSALRSLSPMERRRKGHEGAPRHRLSGVAELWRKNPTPKLKAVIPAKRRAAAREPGPMYPCLTAAGIHGSRLSRAPLARPG